MSGTPNSRQNHFRFRNGDNTNSSESGPWTWLAAEDANFYPSLDTPFRIRFALDNTGTASENTRQLMYSLNGNTYTAVTTSSNVIRGADAGLSDNVALTTANFQLTAGAGTAGQGRYGELGLLGAGVNPSGGYSEFEFGITLRSADVVAGDTIDLRMYNATPAPLATYNITPRITVPAADVLLGQACL